MVLPINTVDVGIPIANEIINTFLLNIEAITIAGVAIAIYGIIVWYYYRSLAKRDFFHFNRREGTGFFAGIINFFSGIQFIAKYIIFYPIISFIFFGLFSVMLFLLSKDQTIPILLLTSATVISATRICAYYNEDLARDLAKMIPLALLGVFIVQADFFSTQLLFERIIALPLFFIEIASFILYFLVLELALRLLYKLKVLILGRNISYEEEMNEKRRQEKNEKIKIENEARREAREIRRQQ